MSGLLPVYTTMPGATTVCRHLGLWGVWALSLDTAPARQLEHWWVTCDT